MLPLHYTLIRAGGENRTLVIWLEIRNSTIELHLHIVDCIWSSIQLRPLTLYLYQVSVRIVHIFGFQLSKTFQDLHQIKELFWKLRRVSSALLHNGNLKILVPLGIEPRPTSYLVSGCRRICPWWSILHSLLTLTVATSLRDVGC